MALVLGDGTSPEELIAIYDDGDGIHPNELATEDVMAPEFATALSQAKTALLGLDGQLLTGPLTSPLT